MHLQSKSHESILLFLQEIICKRGVELYCVCFQGFKSLEDKQGFDIDSDDPGWSRSEGRREGLFAVILDRFGDGGFGGCEILRIHDRP